MPDALTEPVAVALVGCFGGVLLGLAARIGRFCTLGAIEDLVYGENPLRLRMWGVAIGVSIIGVFGLSAAGLLDLGQTLYLSRGWNPAASVFGGLVFGYGMALAGNCGYGALARAGGGDIGALVVVLVMGISAYVALGGLLSAPRLWLFGGAEEAATAPSFAHAAARLGFPSVEAAGLLVGAGCLALALTGRGPRASAAQIFWGGVVGVAVVSGWLGTQWVARHGFDATPVISHTFSAPVGETLLYAMTSSGNSLSFGAGSVAGVLIGACAASLVQGRFRWEACDDPRELRRQMLGGALMGVGAVVAVGCSVGQGLSAFSVLAYSAPLTLAAIGAGAALGLRQLITGFSRSV